MSYSDYGGYAYRNGVRVVERSDAVLAPEIISTPGAWPGFLPQAQAGYEHFHVLLGDGPIFVGLYKQTWFSVHRSIEDLGIMDGLDRGDYDLEHPFVVEVDGVMITVVWEETDNHYLYVQLKQPDGTCWCGWSGYGVGAGLEEVDYGYNTQDCEIRCREIFPEGMKER